MRYGYRAGKCGFWEAEGGAFAVGLGFFMVWAMVPACFGWEVILVTFNLPYLLLNVLSLYLQRARCGSRFGASGGVIVLKMDDCVHLAYPAASY